MLVSLRGRFIVIRQTGFGANLLQPIRISPLLLPYTIRHSPATRSTPAVLEVDAVLFGAFKATGVYPDMVLSGHVHNYQRFTKSVTVADGTTKEIAFIVAGAGGYSKLGNDLHNERRVPHGTRRFPLEAVSPCRITTRITSDFCDVR